jgi:hypothetical protein
MKYEIIENTDEFLWNALLDDVDNSIFSRDFFLKPLRIKYKKFTILDKNIVKGCFCILLDESMEKIIDNDYVIHSGLYILEKNLKKNLGSKNNEIFDITSDFVNFITFNYKEVDISLNIKIKDIRPFLWHNYFEAENKKFKVDVKYTTILNLDLLDNSDDYNNNLFLNLSELRRRNIRSSKKNNINFSYTIDTNCLIDAHAVHLKSQNQLVTENQKNQMYSLIFSLVKNEKAIVQGSYLEGKLRYIVCYAYDALSAYFLFGAPVGENDLNFLGSASHFNMCRYLKNKNIKRVNLEGVNSSKRGRFKLSFGGDLLYYYNLKLN